MTEQLLLNDRYRLLELLATGGMGEVWRAADQLLARLVAVKVLRREFASDDAARSRFQAEARFAASLHHSGIAQVFDYGRQDDVIYLVMELVDGEPLSKIISRTGGLDAEATLDLVAQSARALQVAHTAGIIHRDIKPGNLMVTGDGTIKVTDFGIARAAAVSTLTQTGMVMGTAHYVSPEQASGQSITPATDLYSLGVVAFECLTGEPPFDADTPVGIALQHVRELPPELPSYIPGPVRELVRRLLAKNPLDRPGNAQELADEAFAIREALISGADGFQHTAAYDSVAAFDHGEPTRSHGIPPEFTEPAGLDTLASEVPSNERHRSPLLLASVAMGVLLFGVILIGSLWPDPQGAGLNGNNTTVPASTSSPGTRGDLTDPSPLIPAPPILVETSPTATPESGGTTAPSPSASPTVRVTVKPTRTRPTTPHTTPPKTVPTPSEPSPPDPDPSSSAGPAQGS